jgi:hypothetical protein
MVEKVESRLTKLDRQVHAMQKLILTRMKMPVKNYRKHEWNSLRMEESRIAMREELRLLAAQQRQTAKTVDRFIRSMERGRNGHA